MRPATRASWWAGMLPTAVLPAAVAMVTVVGTVFAQRHAGSPRPLDVVGVLLLMAGPAALVVRRWHAPVVYAVVVTVLLAYVTAGYPFGPVPLASFVALATTIGRGHRLPGYAITAGALLVGAAVHVLRYPGEGLPLAGFSAWVAWVAAFVAAVELWRARRERRAQADAVAAESERRRGMQERLRIAHDLHDVLGHHVSLINVQAGVALYLMDDDPEQARSALTAIKQSSRDLLRDMRSTLGVLRSVDEEPPHEAVAGLARMDELVEATREAGLPVTVETTGEPRELAPSVDTAAYRIVQEALTNARKHAGPARASVLLTYTEDGLAMRIDDDGAGTTHPASSGGNGLPGMEERAGAVSGTLTAGPRPDGGFRVDAYLPTRGDSR